MGGISKGVANKLYPAQKKFYVKLLSKKWPEKLRQLTCQKKAELVLFKSV
jgi:hypothetical protein